MGGGVAHSDTSVSKINIVSKDFRSIIARLFPVQYKAHGRRIRIGIEVSSSRTQRVETGSGADAGVWQRTSSLYGPAPA